MHNRIATISFFLLIFGFLPSFSQGIEFFKGSFEEALEKANKEDKLIFVDAYTKWCGPCKIMARNVFPQKAAGEFYNRSFINMQIDMEVPAGRKFGSQYPVTAYPTLFFINGDGEVVKKKLGGQRLEGLIQLGKQAVSIYDDVDALDKLYADGKKDAAFLRKYVKALNRSEKPSLKVANEYLRTQTDLTTKENLRFIFDAVTTADSRVFDLLIKHRSQIEGLKSKETVNQLIYRACTNTAQKATEFDDKKLVDQAKSTMKKHYASAAKEFGYGVDMAYYKHTKDPAKFLKTAKSYRKKVIKKNVAKQHSLAQEAIQAFPSDKGILGFAEALAAQASEVGGLWNYHFLYAQILAKQGKKAQAIEVAEKAIVIAREKKESIGALHRFVQQLKRT